MHCNLELMFLFQSLLEIFLGIKIKITGDKILPNERNLILMNHRSRLDWLYFWSVLVRMSGVKTEKIILKAPLKNIPGAGMIHFYYLHYCQDLIAN